MIEFGKTLREAREARGYSISQIAEMTHMLSAVVDGLEREDFSHIPAPIYGRGFVRLYCDAVGLDPKPLVALFMAKITGTAPAPGVPTPAAPEPPPAAPEPEPEPVASEPPPPPEPVRPAPVIPEPPPVRTVRAPFRQAQPDLFNPPPEPPPRPPRPEPPATEEESPHESHATLSRYSVPLQTKPTFNLPTISIPPRVWRIGALGLGVLVLLVLLGFGLHALYRATTEPADTRPTAADTIEQTASDHDRPARAPAAATDEKPAAAARAPREIQKIPPLYFD